MDFWKEASPAEGPTSPTPLAVTELLSQSQYIFVDEYNRPTQLKGTICSRPEGLQS